MYFRHYFQQHNVNLFNEWRFPLIISTVSRVSVERQTLLNGYSFMSWTFTVIILQRFLHVQCCHISSLKKSHNVVLEKSMEISATHQPAMTRVNSKKIMKFSIQSLAIASDFQLEFLFDLHYPLILVHVVCNFYKAKSATLLKK